jgi:hypothetical protein
MLAVTKTPSATMLAMPALLLLLAHLVVEACRGERWPLTALATVLTMSIFVPAVVKEPGYGYPTPRVFAGVLQQTWWVIDQLAGTLALVAVLAIVGMVSGGAWNGGRLARYLRLGAGAFCALVLAWLGNQTIEAAWQVTCMNRGDPVSVEIGQFARRRLPDNAVLLCEERKGYEHLTLMFYSDRTCYGLRGRPLGELGREVLQAGGLPYVVSIRKLLLPAVYVSAADGPTIYEWKPAVDPFATSP